MTEKPKVECCPRGKEFIQWKTAAEADHDEDGFFLYLKGNYPDGWYEPINHCPFCGSGFLEMKEEDV